MEHPSMGLGNNNGSVAEWLYMRRIATPDKLVRFQPEPLNNYLNIMKTKLISLLGKKGHGKDLVADIILALHYEKYVEGINGKVTEQTFLSDYQGDYGDMEMTEYWEKKSWAAKLKQIAAMLLGVPVRLLDDRKYKYTELPEQWWLITDGIFVKSYTPELWAKYQKLKNHRLVKPTPRWFMQKLGTEAMRKITNPNIWINALFSDYDPTDDPHWIITDTRFPNEFEAVKDRGGITIKVERHTTSQAWQKTFETYFTVVDAKGWDKNNFNFSWFEEKITQEEFVSRVKNSTCQFHKPFDEFLESINHESETAQDTIKDSQLDYIIINDGSIQDLIDKMREMCIQFNII